MFNKATDLFWPAIHDKHAAKAAVRNGYWTAYTIAVLTFVLIVYRAVIGNHQSDTYPYDLAYVLLMTVVGYFISRMSRTAAVTGLLICIFELLLGYLDRGSVGIYVLFTLFMINAVRGSFVYNMRSSS